MGGVLHEVETKGKKFVDYMTDFDVEFVSLVDHGSIRAPFKIIRDEEFERAKWTSKYINSLPNSSFAVIETGYKEGDSSKSARHLPFKDASGKVDLPHLRNALARCNQIKNVLGNDTDSELRARAQRTLAPYAKKYLNKKGEAGMNDVIQSVLVPVAVDIESLKEKLVWLHDMEVTRVEEFDHYKKFNHQDIGAFKPESLAMERLEDGALALVGELVEPNPKALTLRAGSMDKLVGISSNGFIQTFGDIVMNELDNLFTNIVTTLSMDSLDAKSKKKAVSSALNAFSTYVSMGLDNADANVSLRLEERQLKKTEEVELMEEKVVQVDEISVEERITRVLEDKLPEILDKVLEARMEEAAAKLAEVKVAEPVEKAEEPVIEVKAVIEKEEFESKLKELEAMVNRVKELEERVAKYEEEDSTFSRVQDDKEPVVRKDAEPESVFKGLILRNFSMA